jgi:mono/diheme cytochrome c family protein
VILDRDLRDVAVSGGQLYVARFRSAELLTIDANGQIAHRENLAGLVVDAFSTFTPDAAWRMVAASPLYGEDGVFIVHQRTLNGVVHTSHGGYGDDGNDLCSHAIVHSTVTRIIAGQPAEAGPALPAAVVPVDLAVAHGADEFTVVSAGNAKIPNAPIIVTFHSTHGGDGKDCGGEARLTAGDIEPIAVAYTLDDQLVVQSREPARLVNVGTGQQIDLASDSVADTGHDVFHANAGTGIACASCHLEGGDDGRVWKFDGSGLRRTQSLRGGILGTEPFHWDGDQADFSHLGHDVFERRMAGPTLTTEQLAATASWVNSIPLIAKAPRDAAAIARGKALFEDANGAGCVTCHNGPKMTNSAIVDVGTSGKFKVPRLLGLVDRAPYLHDGRAATLIDRFSVGGGDLHGKTSQLDAAQIADLVAYLESI